MSTRTFTASMVVVHGCGIVLTGAANTGKSELALELVERGHGFVADDGLTVTRSQRVLWGEGEALAAGLLMVRDLGALDIAALFGPQAWIRRHPIHLIVALKQRLPPMARSDLCGVRGRWRLLEVALPVHYLQASPGRATALLVELLARQFRQPEANGGERLAARQAHAISRASAR